MAKAKHRKSDHGVTAAEAQDVEDRSAPRPPVIYEIIRRQGDQEMARPLTSLWWSGVAAGWSMSFSLLAQAILETHLPDAPWRPLVASFGYSAGFLIVVLGRQQLFTESTLTAVLPVMAEFTWANLTRMLRLWTIVLAANLAGTLFAAAFCTYTPVLTADLYDGMVRISGHLTQMNWIEVGFRGIAAGFLIAAMVWLLPAAEGNQVHIITLATYLIAVGGFVHIIAGSMESFLLLLNGGIGIGEAVMGFFIPALAGNIVGGTALFALISYAQVMEEI